MSQPWQVYDLLLDVAANDSFVEQVIIGQHWTLLEAEGIGLSMSPLALNRQLPWPGSLRGRSVKELASWIRNMDPHKAAVGQAALNAIINTHSRAPEGAVTLAPSGSTRLAVFEHFHPQLIDKKVVVVGHYPELARGLKGVDLHLTRQMPEQGENLDSFTAHTVAQADWVFLSAYTLANKCFHLYAELARDSNLVLMGPATPWLPELAELGVDFLAGISITDEERLRQMVMEGAGTCIFEDVVQYQVADIGAGEMSWIKTAISDTVARRERIKSEMENWYASCQRGRFPGQEELVTIDAQLSSLDSQFKRMWDARH